MQTLFYSFFILVFCLHSFSQTAEGDLKEDDLGDVNDAFQELFFEALKQSGIENYEKANIALLKALSETNSTAIVYFELGKNYNHLKQFNNAELALLEAEAQRPDNQWIKNELLKAYLGQVKYDQAIKVAKELAEKHLRYKQQLATILVEAKRFEEAKIVLSNLIKTKGQTEFTDRLSKQIELLTNTPRLTPSESSVSVETILEKLKTEQKSLVIESLNKQLVKELETDSVTVNLANLTGLPNATLISIASLLESKNNTEQAFQLYEQTLSEPNFLGYKGVLSIKKEQGAIDYVKSKAEEAVVFFPAQPEGYYYFGWALQQQGETEQARDNLLLGLDFVVDNPSLEAQFYNELSVIYTQLNDLNKAKDAAQKAKTLKAKLK